MIVQKGQATASVLRARLGRLAHALLVDRAASLLHPHVRAARAAAERALAASLHLHRLANRGDELSRRGDDVVVPRQVAGVVVRDRGRSLAAGASRPSRTSSARSSVWWTTS